MLATRLLAVATAGAGFTIPTGLRTLTSSPQGGWTQIQDPKAYHYNGSTYVAYAPDTGTTSDLVVARYVHATGATTTKVLASAFESPPDNHSSPSVLVRTADGRLVVAASHHAEVTSPHIYISPNPEDIAGTWTEVTPDASIGADQYTYMVLYEVGGVLWLWFRDYLSGPGTGRLAYSKSADGGATWSGRTVVYTGSAGHVPYWRIITDGLDRFDIFVTDVEPTASKLGHFYVDASDGKRYTSAGVEIANALPIGWADITQVHAATAWSWGGSWDGAPACVMMVDVGSDNAIKTARWRSGAWQIDTVVASVGGQLTGNQYGSGCAIHHTNPDVVYLAKKATKWEMWRYSSPDDGATWGGTQLTSGSSVDNVWPEVVHHPGVGLEAVWLAGNYTSDTDYAFGIAGWG